MLARREQWAVAYWRQAASDFRVFREFQSRTDLPVAHELHFLLLAEYDDRRAQLETIRRDCAKIARAIEQLAPAVARESAPQNTEYPWLDGSHVVVPIDFDFPSVALLREARGRLFLKLVSRAFAEFDRRLGRSE